MRVLSFAVTGQKLTPAPECDFSDIVSNTCGYLRANFHFSSDWAACKKVAVFTGPDEETPTPLVGDSCIIPASALTGRVVRVCVVGQRSGYRITTNTIEFKQQTGR